MLAYEKFLYDKTSYCDFPVPREKGFLAYQKKENNIRSINFLFFNMQTVKNSLSTYNFKFTTVNLHSNKTKNNLETKVAEVDWENFFKSIDDLVKNISGAESVSVAKTVDEADYLVWKSFVIINDSWFSDCFSKLPLCFFESLDEAKGLQHVLKYRSIFLSYIKENYNSLYSQWNEYYQRDYCDYFCGWFYGYFLKNQT